MLQDKYKLSVFHEIYTRKALNKIAERAKRDKGLNVLVSKLRGDNEYLKIDRVHLDKCLNFAKENGGLDADRTNRLTNPESVHVWQAVYNELLVPNFFSNVFKLKIKFVTNPNQQGLGDFQIIHPLGVIIVEVKTPKGDDPDLQGPKDSSHAGLDEDLIRPVLHDGEKQLKRGNRNLIVICTQLCSWIHDWKPFEKLFYGREVITATLNPKVGRLVGPVRTKFVPDGELNKYRKKRFTRISAIASFRTDIYCGIPFSEKAQQVQFTLLHNYHALCPISPNLFPNVEQFIPNKEIGSIEHINKKKSAFLIEG